MVTALCGLFYGAVSLWLAQRLWGWEGVAFLFVTMGYLHTVVRGELERRDG